MSIFKKRRRRKKHTMKFSKIIVISCISFIVLYTAFQTYLSYTLGIELSPTLTTCVYTFFGTELVAVAVIRIFDSEDSKDTKSTKKSKDDEIKPVG